MPSPYPAADAAFAAFGRNADRVIAPDPESFGLDAGQSAALHDAAEAYAERLAVARDPTTRTTVAVVGKDGAKRFLRDLIQRLFRIADAYPGTTDSMRASLGIRARRAGRAPKHGAPATRPLALITRTLGGFADVLLRDQATPDRRRKPVGVSAALIYTAITPVGAGEPDFRTQGEFAAVATKSSIRLTLPPGTQGQLLWVQARWINGTGQPGPAGVPTAATIAG